MQLLGLGTFGNHISQTQIFEVQRGPFSFRQELPTTGLTTSYFMLNIYVSLKHFQELQKMFYNNYVRLTRYKDTLRHAWAAPNRTALVEGQPGVHNDYDNHARLLGFMYEGYREGSSYYRLMDIVIFNETEDKFAVEKYLHLNEPMRQIQKIGWNTARPDDRGRLSVVEQGSGFGLPIIYDFT